MFTIKSIGLQAVDENVKRCSKCSEFKSKTEFNKCAKSKDGLFSWCRSCAKKSLSEKYKANPEYWNTRNQKWAEQNRDKSNAIKRKWAKSNPEKDYESKLHWRLSNPEKNKQCNAEWSRNNRDKCNKQLADYRAKKKQATPSWANHEIIELIYAEALHRGAHVDHIVPLQNDTVCGLHVEYNLQLLSPLENQSKGNKWPYEPRVPFA